MKSYRKGYINEYKLTKDLSSLNARRVPLSGMARGFKGDIILEMDGKSYVAEVKVRRDAFKRIYSLIEDYDISDNMIYVTTLDRFLAKEKKPLIISKLPKSLYNWLQNRDFLFFRSNYEGWCVAWLIKE